MNRHQKAHEGAFAHTRYLVRHLVACRDVPSLEDLLYDYSFLASAVGQGCCPAIIRDLLALPEGQRTTPVDDALRWLQVQQDRLAGEERLDAQGVLVSGLRCPPGTVPFRRAQAAAEQAAAGGKPNQWKLKQAPGAVRSWPAAKLVLQGHQGAPTCLAWSPDGRTLASGSEDHHIILWDVLNGERLGALTVVNDKRAYCLAWSPDGRMLASGDTDNHVRLWDAASGGCSVALK
ncbi:WD repeat domain-containing protein, partial [Tetrabaena socialis]